MTDLNEIFAGCPHPDRFELTGYIEAQTGLPEGIASKLALGFLDRFIVLQRFKPVDAHEIELQHLQRGVEAAMAALLDVIQTKEPVESAWNDYQAAFHSLLKHAAKEA